MITTSQAVDAVARHALATERERLAAHVTSELVLDMPELADHQSAIAARVVELLNGLDSGTVAAVVALTHLGGIP